jgi:uncharacterized protein (DUF1778 family)
MLLFGAAFIQCGVLSRLPRNGTWRAGRRQLLGTFWVRSTERGPESHLLSSSHSSGLVPVVRRMVYDALMAVKTERLNLRLTPGQDAVLRRAAEARGESASDYVLRHAVEAAEMDLADRRVFMVDDAAWTELQALVSAPPRLPPQMAKLLSSSSVLEKT